MKNLLLILLTIFSINVFGQKSLSTTFNKLLEVENTPYFIVEADNSSKAQSRRQSYLLFINTENGTSNRVDFENLGYYMDVKQVKIDELNINTIIVSAKTIDLDGKKGINWADPTQIFVISIDGKNKTRLTERHFFTKTWVINKHAGTVVVTGYYDLNRNGKNDESEMNEIQIYDLKTLKLLHKI